MQRKYRKSIVSTVVLGAALLLPGAAMAQGTGFGAPTPPAPPVPPGGSESPVYSPTPAAPQPVPPPAPSQVAQLTPDAPPSARPQGTTLGLGLGYVLGGTALDLPSAASARFRLASSLTFEPFIRLATHSQSSGSGNVKNAQNELFVGTNIRKPLKSRGKVDLLAVVGAEAGTITDDPDGGSNNTTTTEVHLSYGLSVEYWYSSNWCISFTARNPLINYTTTSQEVSNDLDTSDIDVGAIWDPTTDLSVHLFY